MIHIWFPILITLLFSWLGYETKWFTVRLLVGLFCESGIHCQWRLPDDVVTRKMQQELINLGNNNHRKSWGEFKDYMVPLCGWGYAYQYRNLQPEYQIELIAPGSHYTLRTSDMPTLRDVFRIYRNPYLKVRL